MLIFKTLPSEQGDSPNNMIDATHEWGLPGVICPVCGNTWSNIGLAYPWVSLSRNYRLKGTIEFPERCHLMSLHSKKQTGSVPSQRNLCFTRHRVWPLVGKASGKFADFAWVNPWTLLIEQRAYLQLQRTGINLPLTASPKLAFRRKSHNRLVELQIEPHALLTVANVLTDSSPCTACQYSSLSLPEEIGIDESSLPAQVDLFRVRNFTTLILASENFKNATVELGLTGIDFREVAVTRLN